MAKGIEQKVYLSCEECGSMCFAVSDDPFCRRCIRIKDDLGLIEDRVRELQAEIVFLKDENSKLTNELFETKDMLRTAMWRGQ